MKIKTKKLFLKGKLHGVQGKSVKRIGREAKISKSKKSGKGINSKSKCDLELLEPLILGEPFDLKIAHTGEGGTFF